MIRADMHIHTLYSDGLITPEEVAERAHQKGLGFLVVTDHDCALGYPEVKESCSRLGIQTVCGIEVSAFRGDVKLHTLGYRFDASHATFQAFYRDLYENSIKQTEEILFKLSQNGVKLTMEEVFKARTYSASPVQHMHIAHALAAKGYCNGNANACHSQYLAWGKCAFSVSYRPTPEQAIEVINACGGIASLAHPGRISMSPQDLLSLIKRLKECGLYGIEAYYSGHSAEETVYYKEVAKRYSLIETGGSDTHSFDERRDIGTPEFYLNEPLLEQFGL